MRLPLKILVIASDPTVGLDYERLLAPSHHEIQHCFDPSEALRTVEGGSYDAVLISQTSPHFAVLDILQQLRSVDESVSVLISSRCQDVQAAVSAMRMGALDYIAEPCSPEVWQSALQRVEQAAAARRAPGRRRGEPGAHHVFEGMLGTCPAMRDVFDLIRRIAATDSTVLVTGESGTGKEMVARAIHRHSQRRDAPLLACDCTALAPTLLESELFGHVKGSFSGAVATKSGLFEVAHQGTLLLDEVANLSMETQAKLLRLLETRRVRKVGDTTERDVDIRLIATTNRSLGEMVKEGHFRADLYYRLNVVPIILPPLRERTGDLPLLAMAFLEKFSRLMNVAWEGFTSEAIHQMETYPWPGNVRELRNIVERLAVLYGGCRIELSHLPSEIREARATLSASETPHTWEDFKALKRQLTEELERRFLVAALERCRHNVTQAAESVRMQRTNFHALLRHHGLKPDLSRQADTQSSRSSNRTNSTH